MHRYVSSFSKRSTHLVVSLDVGNRKSAKIQLATHNQERWGTHIVTTSWVIACATARKRLREADFAVILDTNSPAGSALQDMRRHRPEVGLLRSYTYQLSLAVQSNISADHSCLFWLAAFLHPRLNAVLRLDMTVIHRPPRGEADCQACSQVKSSSPGSLQDKQRLCRRAHPPNNRYYAMSWMSATMYLGCIKAVTSPMHFTQVKSTLLSLRCDAC